MAEYCTCSDVESFLRNYGINAGSPGTLSPAEIASICTQISAELESYMTGAKIALPITLPNHLILLNAKATLGAAIEVLKRMNVEIDNRALLQDEWRAFTSQIFSHPAILESRSTGAVPAYYNPIEVEKPNVFSVGKRSW